MKANINVLTDAKEYPELTFEQLKEMVRLMNTGLNEHEARKKVLSNA
jgi:uncharacterized protein (DUF433 family)